VELIEDDKASAFNPLVYVCPYSSNNIFQAIHAADCGNTVKWVVFAFCFRFLFTNCVPRHVFRNRLLEGAMIALFDLKAIIQF